MSARWEIPIIFEIELFSETRCSHWGRNRKLEITYGGSQPDADVVSSGLAFAILQFQHPVTFVVVYVVLLKYFNATMVRQPVEIGFYNLCKPRYWHLALPVRRRPSWMSSFRFHLLISALVPFKRLNFHDYTNRGNFLRLLCLETEITLGVVLSDLAC